MPVPATSPIEASLIEVFSSIQGEGVLIGCRQIFVRFADCNLNCAYCDTPFQAKPVYAIEREPGCGQPIAQDNPADLRGLGRHFTEWERGHAGLHHSICLTGGEPLLHADALSLWLPELSSRYRIYLETNGTLPAEMEQLLPWVKWVSMDLKTQDTTGQPTRWDVHADFMQVARQQLCHVKLLIGAQTTRHGVRQAAAFMARNAGDIPLILQPCLTDGHLSINGHLLLELQAAAAAVHPDTRLIPQVHHLLGIA